MKRRRAIPIATALFCLFLAALLPALASAAAKPAWSVAITPLPANFAPNTESEYLVLATNVGAAPTGGESTLEIALPTEGVALLAENATNSTPGTTTQPTCAPTGQTIVCKTTEAVGSGRYLLAKVLLEADGTTPTITSTAKMSGGEGGEASATSLAPVQSATVPFGFLPGFASPLTDEEGKADLLAGSHPYQQTTSFAFPTAHLGTQMTNAGHPREVLVELPRGLVGNPAASEKLCTEAKLVTESCPPESQVGVIDVTTLVGEKGFLGVSTTALYNMVPPPGSPAEIATNIAGAGLFAHIQVNVRTDGDYGVEAASHDVLAFGQQPIFSVQAQVWGDPSSPAHERIRGECVFLDTTCFVEPRETALLTMPSDCPGKGRFEVRADSWEEPGIERKAEYDGAPLKDCGAIPFEPSIQAQPTTDVSDSPSGLNFALHQSQEEANERAPAPLRDASIAFPPGFTVNASQAGGLGACSEEQIGFDGEKEGQLRFSKAPAGCPDASKLGTVEVTSPALVVRNETTHEVEEQEGEPVLEPLHGSIYLAKPFANPLNSLVATYIAVEDPKLGIVAKLAGKAILDPNTGQVTARFEENPELPFEDVKVHLFGGARGAFVTPSVCGTFTTTTELTPWSGTFPEKEAAEEEELGELKKELEEQLVEVEEELSEEGLGEEEREELEEERGELEEELAGLEEDPTADSFQVTAAPSGGACPTSEAQLPNAPKLVAGTTPPSAGQYAPLLFKLSREDGTQRLGKIEATLPPGLTAKLAGVASCPESGIAQAHAREAPNQGALEQASPSCPAASEIGVVNAAAGAGPTPYYTQGHAYLAGPYKGAPLSIVAIAPAVAGPFDLGTVVVRSALYIDPETAQVRVVSDPLPQVVQGVAVDLRSVAVRAERPNFSLNPTSCAEKSFGGQALSTLGQPAPLFERFQVGGCSSLPYKPKLTAKLFGRTNRGAHPRLRSVFTARPGDANTARISFALPHSEFIDQAHFRTICTRVQFAANQCPAGAVYGHIVATSPLVDYALEGPIYLRSSSHKLPDVVAVLKGPPSQPIEVDLDGRVDSVNGGIRTTFETVPDQPVSRAVVSLQGGKKGLFQNSTNICKGTHRVTLKLDAQNGKVSDSMPKLVAQCGKKGKKGNKKHNKGGGKK